MSNATSRILLHTANFRQRIVSLALLVFVSVAAYVLWADSPAESTWFPKCPVYYTTGLHCPGCGASRSMHHVLHGRIGDAMQHNQLLIILGTPVVAILILSSTISLFFGKTFRLALPRWWPTLILLIFLFWFVIRNLPGFDGLHPPDVTPL
jgi:hypothetical protein